MTRYAAKGTLLKKQNTGSPAGYTTIAQIFGGPDGPSYSADELDVTDHSSAGGFREFIAGLKDAGEVSGELHFDPSNGTHDDATGLIGELEDGSVKNYQILFPDSSTVTFAAIVTAFEPSAPVDGKLTASFTLKVSGKPTWA
jgi:predicted secreted protein